MLTGDNADSKSTYKSTPVSKYSFLPLTPFRPEAPVRRKREHPVTRHELQQDISGGNCLLRLRATNCATSESASAASTTPARSPPRICECQQGLRRSLAVPRAGRRHTIYCVNGTLCFLAIGMLPFLICKSTGFTLVQLILTNTLPEDLCGNG